MQYFLRQSLRGAIGSTRRMSGPRGGTVLTFRPGRATRRESVPEMTTPSPSPRPPDPLRFSLTGTVATWDAVGRWLRIVERTLWVAPGVVVAGSALGATITVIGYQEALTARWIVTELTPA